MLSPPEAASISPPLYPINLPTCPVPLLGRDLLAKVGASISFVPSIHLTLDSSSAPLLLLATQHTDSNTSFPLPASQVDPNSEIPQTPLLLNTIPHHHPDTLPKLSTHSHSRSAGAFNLSSLTSWEKNYFVPHLLPLTPYNCRFKKKKEKKIKPMGSTVWFKTSSSLILQWSHSTLLGLTLTHSFLLSPQGPLISQIWISRMHSSLPLSIQSQNIFAFTWIDPDIHLPTQFTWTVLPQWFWDSPHVFGQALA